ncbi:MAG: hypothetical protein RL147_902, partial [Actinomycetota bacterium]
TFTTHKFRPDGRMEIEITGQNILFIAPCIELVTGSILLEDIQYYG